MIKNYTLQLKDEVFEIVVEDKENVFTATLGDKTHRFELLLDKSPIYTFLVDEAEVLEVEASLNDEKCDLLLGQIPYCFKIFDPMKAGSGSNVGPSASGGIIEAPMAGKVVDIKISKEDSVTQGQVALIIEAMKMQNEMTCPCEGIVKEVCVSVGTSVEAGQKLIIIE